jgi:hypothetical protein
MNRIIFEDPVAVAVRAAIAAPSSTDRDEWLRAQRDSGRLDEELIAEINHVLGETN